MISKGLPEIHSDIRKAETLPGWFYSDPEVFQLTLDKVFARSWQWSCHSSDAHLPGQVFPFTFLDKVLEEPLLFSRDKKAIDGITFVLDGPAGVEPVKVEDRGVLADALAAVA